MRNPGFEEAFKQAVEETFSGKFGPYDVTTTVTEGNENTVNYYPGQREVNGAITWAEVPLNRGVPMEGDIAKSAMAHEAGHTMGLRDGYDLGSDLPLIDPKTGLPRDDLMAVLLGHVNEDLIKELVKANGLTGRCGSK